MIPYALDCLKVVSYNWRGWKSGSNCVQSLLQSCGICLVQEHWLLRENLDSLTISDDFLSVGVSGIDSSILLTGCPFGGCSILYRKSLQWFIGSLLTLSVCVLSRTMHVINPHLSFSLFVSICLLTILLLLLIQHFLSLCEYFCRAF